MIEMGVECSDPQGQERQTETITVIVTENVFTGIGQTGFERLKGNTCKAGSNYHSKA